MEKEEDIPKWARFMCPSCGISYGISALVDAVKKRRKLAPYEVPDIS